MSKVSGILCAILRRFVETEFPAIDFRAACEQAGCDCGSGAFSVAHRVDQTALLKALQTISAQSRRDLEQFLEEMGRSAAGILRSSYPTTFRSITTVAEFSSTAASLDYSLLFPTVSSELAPILWNSCQPGREMIVKGFPDRLSAQYLRGFFEGAASVIGEPVAVRLNQASGALQLSVVSGRITPAAEPARKVT